MRLTGFSMCERAAMNKRREEASPRKTLAAETSNHLIREEERGLEISN